MVDQILPGLYLSSKKARRHKFLQRYDIKKVLTLRKSARRGNAKDVTYKCIKIKDRKRVRIIDYFEECIEFIHEARTNNQNVLVHCKRGKSRSATICIAYIMTVLRVSCDDALRFVHQRRSKIKPNNGFINQLKEYEDKINPKRSIYNRKDDDRKFYDQHKNLISMFSNLSLGKNDSDSYSDSDSDSSSGSNFDY